MEDPACGDFDPLGFDFGDVLVAADAKGETDQILRILAKQRDTGLGAAPGCPPVDACFDALGPFRPERFVGRRGAATEKGRLENGRRLEALSPTAPQRHGGGGPVRGGKSGGGLRPETIVIVGAHATGQREHVGGPEFV